jgi:flagellar motor switch protein FliG
LSDLVEMDDLIFLDGHDLRAVLDQVSETQKLEALIGIAPAVRKQLLNKVSPASANRLEAQINAHGPVTIEAVQDAQRALVEALYRLSRGGQVAFDVPEDMVA